MSLILEALRKSEAERRRGESPDLYAELPPVTRVQPQTKPIWWWLVLAAVVVAALAWWLGSRQSPPVEPLADSTGEVGQRDRIADAGPPRIEAPAIAESPAAPVEPVPESEPDPRPATPAPVPASPAVVAAPAPPAPADTKPERETNKEAVAVAPRAPPAPEPLPALPIAVPEPLPVAPPAPPAPGTVERNEGLLQLADLPVAERKQLPPLKLSMHMWNDAPAQRFVIIDGQRLSEGGRIGDAVLVAIRTDGVVLDWNGRRLKLPIR